jgi:hypothetical protein
MKARGWRWSALGASIAGPLLNRSNFRPLRTFRRLIASWTLPTPATVRDRPGVIAFRCSRLYPQAKGHPKRHPQISWQPHDPKSRPDPS